MLGKVCGHLVSASELNLGQSGARAHASRGRVWSIPPFAHKRRGYTPLTVAPQKTGEKSHVIMPRYMPRLRFTQTARLYYCSALSTTWYCCCCCCTAPPYSYRNTAHGTRHCILESEAPSTGTKGKRGRVVSYERDDCA